MERITTFNMSADLATLQGVLGTGEVPAQLREPIQALVQRISEAATGQPVSIYLCAPDEHALARDHFGYLLARTLSQHIPSTMLVDCDFLSVGMHGLVPEADALGFLDLLLYGSSIGVITQQAAGGVKTVGAGSFPVTKRMPFVMGAFEDANRRLLNHAGCVVYVGPLFGDDGDMHPLLGAVSHPLLVRQLAQSAADAIDPVEERIASAWETELTSVRLVAARAGAPRDETFSRVLGDDDLDAETEEAPVPPPPPPIEPPPPPPRRPEPTFAELADTGTDDPDLNVPPPPEPESTVEPEPPQPTASPAPSVPPFTPGGGRQERKRRRGPVVAWVIIALVAAAAAVWWVGRQGGGPIALPGQRSEPAATTAGAGPETTPQPAALDTVAAANAAPDTAGQQSSTPVPPPAARSDVAETVVEEPEYVDPADTGGGSGGTVHISSHDIHVMEDLEQNWAGYFFIHISSFRRSVEARDEVAYLESREFPVFIVFLDLDAKGKWYRVYAGPFATRDEAREVKKSLDDIPRVRFTRITQISG